MEDEELDVGLLLLDGSSSPLLLVGGLLTSVENYM